MIDKVVIILAGLPGSGKSTLASFLTKDGGHIFCTDDFFEGMEWSAAMLGKAHSVTFNSYKEAVDKGQSPLVVSNTATRTWEYKHYEDYAKEHGYEVFPVIMRRNKEQVFANLHNVSKETVAKMQDRMLEDFKKPMMEQKR